MDYKCIFTMLIAGSTMIGLASFVMPSYIYAQIFVTELAGEEQPLPTNTNAFGNITIIGNN